MKRHKGELLDLLRKQESANGPAPIRPQPSVPVREEKPQKASRPKRKRPALKFKLPEMRFALPRVRPPKLPRLPRLRLPALKLPRLPRVRLNAGAARRAAVRLPWAAAGVALLVGVPCVLWLGDRFGGEPAQAAERPALSTAAPATGESASNPAAAPAAAVSEEPLYGILAITYNFSASSPENSDMAKRVANLLDRYGYPDVRLFLRPPEEPKFLEVFVGQAADTADLQPVLQSLRQFSLPEAPQRKDFAGASIRRLPVPVRPSS